MAKRRSKQDASGKAAPKPMDAVQIMKADHKQVRKLFERFSSAADDQKAAISSRLLAEIDLHTRLEEELVYPALRTSHEELSLEAPALGNGLDLAESHEANEDPEGINGMELVVDEDEDEEEEGQELIAAAYNAHQTMKDLTQQLRSLDPTGEDYRELLAELEETVFEHVADEEATILPLVAAQLDVQAIGMEMQRRKDDFQSQSPIAA